MAEENVIPLTSDNDAWHKAVALLTGYEAPLRHTLFEKLLGNEGIKQMKVEITKQGSVKYVDPNDFNWRVENAGYRIENTDFVIPFYMTSGDDASAGDQVSMYKARITMLGNHSTDSPPAGGVVEGGEFKSQYSEHLGLKDAVWSTAPLTQYAYGTGRALEALLNTDNGTHGFSWNGVNVADEKAVSLKSFDTAAAAFDRVAQFFSDRQQTVAEWQRRVGTEQNDAWRGQAAGVFWHLIDTINRQYEGYAKDMGAAGGRSKQGNELREASRAFRNAALKLHSKWAHWELYMGNPLRWLHDLLVEITDHVWERNIKLITYKVNSIGGYYGTSYYTTYHATAGFDQTATRFGKSDNFGPLDQLSTWKAVGERAVQNWQASVIENLVEPANAALDEIHNAWGTKNIDLGSVRTRGEDDLTSSYTEDLNKKKEEEAEAAAEEANRKNEEFMAWQKAEAERAKAEAERKEKEAAEKEAAAKAEAERKEAEAKAEAERKEKEAAEKEAAAKAEAEAKEAAAKAEAERKEAEARAEQENKEQEAEAKQQEAEAKAEQKEAQLRAEQEAKEQEAEAKAEQLRAEQEAKQQEAERKQEEAQARAEQLQISQFNQARADQEAARKEQERKAAEAEEEAERKEAEARAEQEAKEQEAEAKQQEAEEKAEQRLREQEAAQAEAEKEQRRLQTEQELRQEQMLTEMERQEAERQAEAEARQEAARQEAQAVAGGLDLDGLPGSDDPTSRVVGGGDLNTGDLGIGDLGSGDLGSGDLNTGDLPGGYDIPDSPYSGDTLTNPGGSVTTLDDNGRLVTEYPDGSTVRVDPDLRTATVTLPDGTVQTGPLNVGDQLPNPDGSVTGIDRDGNIVTEYPDGTVTTVDPDTGASTTTRPDGTVSSGYLNGTTGDLPTGPTTLPPSYGSGNLPSYDYGSYEEELYDDSPYDSVDTPPYATPASASTGDLGTPLNTGSLPGGVGMGGTPMGGMPMGGMPMGGTGAGGGQSQSERVRNVIDDGQPLSTRGGRYGTGAATRAGQDENDVRVSTPRATATTTGSSPFLPMGGPGGAPAGRPETQSGDRTRESWAQEDDDVWGTDEGGAPAVIGR
ncbi:AAWKG family protein [Streptomyces sp. NPDC057877]|uniref:AAWKG family protein n=1 Tax=Streptomyces sp. NPDC057877 TaxID=3346269 RepID=UPI0036AB8044